MSNCAAESAKLSATVHKEIRGFTDPLFVQDFFVRTGRNAGTACATATFVRFQGEVYAITCRHVLEHRAAAEPGAGLPVLAFGVGAGIFNMANFVKERDEYNRPKVQSLFVSPRYLEAEREADIAMARMGTTWYELSERKQKTYIDLDAWVEPAWGKIATCAAAGYLTEHKLEAANGLVTKLAVSTVGLASRLASDTATFRLHSTLPDAHGYWMSGMSGGPVLGLKSASTYDPIGIIFEGGPSSPGAEEGLASGPNQLHYAAHLLTPATFEDWLRRTTFPDLDPFVMWSKA